jgi:hypothetical protein
MGFFHLFNNVVLPLGVAVVCSVQTIRDRRGIVKSYPLGTPVMAYGPLDRQYMKTSRKLLAFTVFCLGLWAVWPMVLKGIGF